MSRPQNDRQRSRSPALTTRRIEAFSDAVFAIAITLLALNLQVPELTPATPEALAADLAAMWPTYLSFLLSFVTLLIAWVYHHRLLEAAKHAGTGLLFTNGMLLLIVSSLPFPTALLGAYLTTPATSVVALCCTCPLVVDPLFQRARRSYLNAPVYSGARRFV